MIGLTRGTRKLPTQAARTILVLLLLVGLPLAAFAHAKLVRSQPKAKDTLSQAPKLVELWFSEELDASPGLNTI